MEDSIESKECANQLDKLTINDYELIRAGKPVGVLERYEAHEVSWRLKRKLSRENPDVLIYTGITLERPISIIVHHNGELKNKPNQWSEYNVMYMRG